MQALVAGRRRRPRAAAIAKTNPMNELKMDADGTIGSCYCKAQ